MGTHHNRWGRRPGLVGIALTAALAVAACGPSDATPLAIGATSTPISTAVATASSAPTAAPTSTPSPTASPLGDWTQSHNGPTHEGYNTAETTISPSTVANLGVAWTGATGRSIESSPAVATGVVYVGSSDGKLYAYAVGCASGGASCSPLWTGATGDSIYSSPAVANGVVYVGSDDGKLYAFG